MKISTADLLQTTKHPKLLADKNDVAQARKWIEQYPWYSRFFEKKKTEIDNFLRRPIYISPLKQAYEYPNYDCLKHKVTLKYEEDSPFEHRCPVDEEVFVGEKYDAAWAGWYHGLLSRRLIWMGTVYQITGEERYAEAARDVLVRFADTYLNYPNENNILGPARIFFGTLGESIFGTNIALGYDLVYESPCFSQRDHEKIRDRFLFPLAELATQFDETVSNRQSWYNNAVASIGFVTNRPDLLEWAFNGKRGFLYQLTSGLPKSGFWYEGPGYHFFTLEGFILIAEMSRHHGLDLYGLDIAGHSIRKMFDAPLDFLAPDFTFPRIKDSGGGSIFSPEKISKYEVGYARYGEERYGQLLKYAYEQKGIERELEFFFICKPELPDVQKPIYRSVSTNLEGNGCAVLRDNVDGDEKFLYLDYGTVGGEHGHPDRLGVGYYAFGHHWLLDPLNQDYFKPNLQTWFRQTIAHNTVVLNQSNQAWANGHLNFLGETPGLKVASGYSDRLYGGASIRRTIALLGAYCIDVCEVNAEDERIIDYPIHSFGELHLEGVPLSRRPDVMFGKPPGIPGYDQFTEIYSGISDSDWKAEFKLDGSSGLMLHVLGEESSQIFSAMAPGIREDYEKRLPMLFCRRIARQTRFVTLLEGYRGKPGIRQFKCTGDDLYEILLGDERHLLRIDPEENAYFCVKYVKGKLSSLSLLNSREVTVDETILIASEHPLENLHLHLRGTTLEIEGSEEFVELKINGFHVDKVTLNGASKEFTAVDDSITLRSSDEEDLKLLGEKRVKLFVGLQNTLKLPIGNPSSEEKSALVELQLQSYWREVVEAQVNDWGGIVNLPALHKNSILTRTYPEPLIVDGTWLEQAKAPSVNIPARGYSQLTANFKLLNELQPAVYPVQISLGKNTHLVDFQVEEPVSLEYFLANGLRDTLRLTIANHTDELLVARLEILPDSMWKCEKDQWEIPLQPREKRKLDIPISHVQYVSAHQKSPIEVELRCGDFTRRWRKDFYVGYCFRSEKIPALDGSFKNWNTSFPLIIDSEEQISRLLFGNRPWRGSADLSAKVYAMYDDDYFYVGAEVTDDVVSTDFDPRTQMPSDFDSIEIILDTRVNSEQGLDPPTPGVFRHVAVPGRSEIRFDETTKGDIPVRFRQIKDAQTFWEFTERGYHIIVRVPWGSLPLVNPESGMKIGFDIALNDNDSTRFRTNQMLWAGFNQNQSWLDLSLVGALIFKC